MAMQTENMIDARVVYCYYCLTPRSEPTYMYKDNRITRTNLGQTTEAKSVSVMRQSIPEHIEMYHMVEDFRMSSFDRIVLRRPVSDLLGVNHQEERISKQYSQSRVLGGSGPGPAGIYKPNQLLVHSVGNRGPDMKCVLSISMVISSTIAL